MKTSTIENYATSETFKKKYANWMGWWGEMKNWGKARRMDWGKMGSIHTDMNGARENKKKKGTKALKHMKKRKRLLPVVKRSTIFIIIWLTRRHSVTENKLSYGQHMHNEKPKQKKNWKYYKIIPNTIYVYSIHLSHTTLLHCDIFFFPQYFSSSIFAYASTCAFKQYVCFSIIIFDVHSNIHISC